MTNGEMEREVKLLRSMTEHLLKQQVENGKKILMLTSLTTKIMAAVGISREEGMEMIEEAYVIGGQEDK